MEDEIIIIDGIWESTIFIKVHQFLFGSWITPILLLTQLSWDTVKLVKQRCLPLEIKLNYLWPLIPTILIGLSQNVRLACPIFFEHTQGNFTSLGWCGQCMHACMQSRKSLLIHVILGSINYRKLLVHCFYTLPLRDHTIVKLQYRSKISEP